MPLPGLADDLGLQQLRLRGKTLTVEIAKAVTGAVLYRSLDDASRVDLDFSDPHRKVIRSPLFSQQTVATIDTLTFELTRVSKTGSGVSVELRDAAAVDLKRRKGLLVAKAGTTTRGEFIRRLVSEVGWLKATVQTGSTVKNEISRGSANDPDENSWDAIGRLAEEVGWRRFVSGNTVFVGSDAWLMARVPPLPVREHAAGVDHIDFDYEMGVADNAATVICQARRWAAGPGTPVEVADLGVASGRWLVTEIERSLFSRQAKITLARPVPELPEPEKEEPPATYSETGTATSGGGEAATVTAGTGSAWAWPTSGRISSRFGKRSGGQHQGLDIAAPTGTPIRASRAGIVSRAGYSDSYGYVVYVDHDGGFQTRYAHMVRTPSVRTGQAVKQGDQLGGVGSTGQSTGPHLHFEIRLGGTPKNPESYLPRR